MGYTHPGTRCSLTQRWAWKLPGIELNIFLFSFPRPLALAVRKHPEIRESEEGGWQHRCADEGCEGVLWVPWPVHRGV